MGKIADFLCKNLVSENLCSTFCMGNCKLCKLNYDGYPPDFMFELDEEIALILEERIMKIMEEE